MNDAIPIVLCSDNNYAIPLYVTIASAIKSKNEGTSYRFNLMVSDGFSKNIKNSIDNLLKSNNCPPANWICMGQQYSGEQMQINHITAATYYRLQIHNYLDDDKCIYLDVDVCVCNDLTAYFNIDIRDSYIAGVKAAGYYATEEACRNKAESLGIKTFDRYVNAGVLLMNLNKIRKNNMGTRFSELMSCNFQSQDQDILNSACYPYIKVLAPKYNAMTKYPLKTEMYNQNEAVSRCYTYEEWYEAVNNPIIVHYADIKKPWMYQECYFSYSWWHAFEYASNNVADKTLWAKDIMAFFKLTQIRHENMENEISIKIDKLTDKLNESNAKIDKLKNKVSKANAKADNLSNKLKDVKCSWRYRTGGVITYIPRKAKVLLNRVRSMKNIVVFDVAMDSDNLGDEILMKYGARILKEMFPKKNFIHIPIHRTPTKAELTDIKGAKYKFIVGTNIITPDYKKYSLIHYPKNMRDYNNIILMGVGWNNYSDSMTPDSSNFYKSIFDNKLLLSLRDQYSVNKMEEAGFNNVINTNCISLWGMTPEKCKAIPQNKGKAVVFTLTAHRKDPDADRMMIEILLSCYQTVYFWPQGDRDLEYYKTLTESKEITILERSLLSFEELLMQPSIDYIGTRLHGGIHAINFGHRTWIIEVDNRAREIAKDTGLTTIAREDVKDNLKNNIESEYHLDLQINSREIERWRNQFI